MPLSVVMPSYARAVNEDVLIPQNPFWNMGSRPSVSRAAADSSNLKQALQAASAPASAGNSHCDLASQFVLGLVLLVLLLMHVQ